MTTEVYTDGSASGNGKKGVRAGYGVYFGDNDVRNVSEPFFLLPLTNNRAELFACIKAIEQYMQHPDMRLNENKLIIYSDSRYVIDSLTKWLPNWKKKGWKSSKGKPVKNKDLIYWLDKLIVMYSGDVSVKFMHVSAHGKKNEPEDRRHGNDMADLFATDGTEKGRF